MSEDTEKFWSKLDEEVEVMRGCWVGECYGENAQGQKLVVKRMEMTVVNISKEVAT